MVPIGVSPHDNGQQGVRVMSLDVRSRLKRIRAMSLAEIASRASYAVHLAVERRRIDGGTAAESFLPGNLAHDWGKLIAARRSGAGPRFFAGLEDREAMRELFAATGAYAEQGADVRRTADAAQRHNFQFFGRQFTYGPEIDWHADPITRRSWPRVFHHDVPIHQGGSAIGDVKYVWELNRHQFLVDLGRAHWLFGDAASASAIYSMIRSWIAANPYGVGVNWSCALEPAFRAWSWLWAYHFCMTDSTLDDDTHARWLRSFWEHGHFLHRHLEYYSSPYNHLIGEASALYALGVLFPEMPEAARWRLRGRRVLDTRLHTEFHPDGGSVEQSTFYHHATLGFYLLATLLGEANGDPFAPAVDSAIEKGIEFSMTLMQPDGRLPSIGGADDGKSLRLEHLPFWDFRPFQAVGAVRYRRADFRCAAGQFFEDALWLLGPRGRETFFAITPLAPASSAALDASGYYVLRSERSRDADYLCFDCGPQAAGLRRDDVPSAAHGHADCLSVVLWLRGRPVLVDPGFYCYNGDPEWEVHFRRTSAHNTACIDGRDQSRHVHKMAWSQVFLPLPEAWMPAARGGAAGGAHDGYAGESRGIIHRRAVWLHETGCCVICDQFTGRGAHDLQINYQFAPGAAALADGSAVLFDHAELAWIGTMPITGRIRCGESYPGGGWVAPSLGVRVPAPRLTLESTFTAPVATCLTVVAPRLAGQPRRSILGSSGHDRLTIGIRMSDGAVSWFGLPLGRAAESARDLVTSLAVWRDDGRGVALPAPVFEQTS
jgi:hypothetical protein